MTKRLTATLCLVLAFATACSSVAGIPNAVQPESASVGGLEITSGPSGPRPGAADSGRAVANSDGGPIDRLAANAVADVEAFWAETFPNDFDVRFTPLRALVSYDSRAAGPVVCDTDTQGFVNAFYCSRDDTAAWDRGALLPQLRSTFGEMSVVTVLAHEMGHAVQSRLGDRAGINQATPTIVREQQADCFTGAYYRHVAEGASPAFEVSTGPGLNQVLATLFAIRDAVGSTFDGQGAHGSAFDRVTAFQIGFTDGAVRCADLDIAEVQDRSTQTPFSANDQDVGRGLGNLRVEDPENLRLLVDSLENAFPDVRAPELTTDANPCGARLTSAATLCPAENVIALDVGELARIGTPPDAGENGIGDFAAFAEVAAKWGLAAQAQNGIDIDGPEAAWRTACLTGHWAASLTARSGSPLELSPGDLDEAVAELLTERSTIAADNSGVSLRTGFGRVKAFRTGFTSGINRCMTGL